MGDTFKRVLDLVRTGRVKVSEHGYEELADDGILVRDVVALAEEAILVED